MQSNMSKAVTWINHLLTQNVSPHLKMWLQSVVFLFFVNFFNFNFNFAMLHDWPTVYMYLCASNGDTGGVYSPSWASSYKLCLSIPEKQYCLNNIKIAVFYKAEILIPYFKH